MMIEKLYNDTALELFNKRYEQLEQSEKESVYETILRRQPELINEL